VPSEETAYTTGRLLVATPAVEGDAFRRSVILMLHHDDDGAQGVVLNQPLDAVVDAVLPGWQAVATAPQRLFRGGPVATDSAIGLVTVPGETGETPAIHRLFRRIGVVDLDAPPVLVAPEIAGLRIFAGYAGWSGGQLEGEIRRGDWFVVDAEPRDAFTDRPDQLWVGVLVRQRGSLALVASFPDDPSMN
jgi:putative transcriptional regulator